MNTKEAWLLDRLSKQNQQVLGVGKRYPIGQVEVGSCIGDHFQDCNYDQTSVTE